MPDLIASPGPSRLVTRLPHLLSAGLALWLAFLFFSNVAPLHATWPAYVDLPGFALMACAIYPRFRPAVARPAALLVAALAFWLCWRTPNLLANTQAGNLLLAVMAVFAGFAATRMLIHRFQDALLLAGTLAAALACGAWLTGHGLDLSHHWNANDDFFSNNWHRWAGPTPHPNLFAYLCAITLWAGLSRRWRGSNAELPLAALAGALIGFCCFATASRTGWVLFWGTGLAGGAWRLWQLRGRGSHSGAARIALVMFLAAAFSFLGGAAARPALVVARFDSIQRNLSPTPEEEKANPEANIVSRGNIYPDAWHVIQDAPGIGHGMGAYPALGHYEAIHTHQLGLELLLAGGVIAFGLFTIAAGGALLRARDPFLRGMLGIALVSGTIDCFLFFKWPLLWFAFCAGAAVRGAPTHAWLRNAPAVQFARRYAAVILVFIALALVYQLREEFSIDFHAYYGAMRWSAETGKPPYQAWNGGVFDTSDDELTQFLRKHQTETMTAALRFLYPPTAFAQLRAFTWIADPALAARTWRLFNLAALAGCIALAAQWLPRRGRPAASLILCLLIASYSPVRESFWLGQVSIWISFLMLLYLWALHKDRPEFGGAALALATGLKIYPAFWLILLLMHPRSAPRALIAFAATLTAMIALSITTDGVDIWHVYWSDVLAKMSDQPPPGGITLFPFVGGGDQTPDAFFVWCNRGLLVAICLGCAAYAWSLRRATTSRRLRGAAAISAVLFLSMPLVWAHYLVLIGLMLAIVCVPAWHAHFARRPMLLGTPIVAYLLTGHMWPIFTALGFNSPWPARLGLLLVAALPAICAFEQRCSARPRPRA